MQHMLNFVKHFLGNVAEVLETTVDKISNVTGRDQELRKVLYSQKIFTRKLNYISSSCGILL